MSSDPFFARELANFCVNRKLSSNVATVINNNCGLNCVNSFYIKQLPLSQRHGNSFVKCNPFSSKR